MCRYRLAVHLALYFPGGYLPGQDPFDNYLAWLSIRSLEDAGAYVVPVRYDDSLLNANHERFDTGVVREVSGAIAHHQPDRLTILGKSRGTHALRIVCTEAFDLPSDTRLIWQTPVWNYDPSWRAACETTLESLHIVGLADAAYHLPERHAEVRGETLAIPGADHGLEIPGDILGTLDAWRLTADSIIRFASRQ